MAIKEIKMPQLGESVVEATLNSWLVAVGDTVEKYSDLAEVQSDKAVDVIPSSFDGVIKELIAVEGETYTVGAVIMTVETEEEIAEPVQVQSEVAVQAPVKPIAEPVVEQVAEPVVTVPTPVAPVTPPPTEKAPRGRFSPAVRRLSKEHGIDLRLVTGTGLNGRITRKDLRTMIETGNIPTATPEVAVQAPTTPTQEVTLVSPTHTEVVAQANEKAQAPTNIPLLTGDVEIPVTPVRKAIAANMLKSKHEAPHAWSMVEVDVTNLVAYRDAIKDDFKAKEGFNLTYFAFFTKAVSQALKDFPQMNSMWAGDKIIMKKDINLNIAVATDTALYTPVIRNADEKTIKGIAREINDLATKVRTGKITTADMEGGTFTVNNTGSFGSVQSMGIINHPQAAILQVEAIVKRPVVMADNMFGIRHMVNLCLSLDHRVVDGLVSGRFLARVKEILENITKENTSIY